MSRIASVQAHEILDSRGNPTLRVHLTLDNGVRVSSSFLRAHRRACSKLSNFATGTKAVTMEKGF